MIRHYINWISEIQVGNNYSGRLIRMVVNANITSSESNIMTGILHTTIFNDIGKIPFIFMAVEEITLITLSFLWAIHLMRKLKTNSKRHKLRMEDTSTSLEKSKKVRIEYIISRNKNFFLLALCTCECVLVLSTAFLIILGDNFSEHFKPIFSIHRVEFPDFDHFVANLHFTFRVTNSCFLTSLMSMLILIRITTQYMCSYYSYFKQPIQLKYLIIYLYLVSGIIFIFGIYDSYSILIQSIFYPIILMVEYVLYIRYTIKLNRCLYNRYFDSRHHEYQSKWAISYYRKAYIGFKLCSISLTIAILCHIVPFSIVSTAPQAYYLIHLIDKIPSIHATVVWRYVDYVNAVITMISSVFTIVGSIFLVIPYIIFSIGYLHTQIKKRSNFRKNTFYSDSSLISNLIQHHNSAYRRINGTE